MDDRIQGTPHTGNGDGGHAMTPGAFDAQYDQHMVAATIVLTDFFMDYLRLLYAAFDGDITEAIVLGEIGQANTSRYLNTHQRDALPLEALERDEILPGSIRGVNAFSAATASGVPRETARRKINALLAKGWLEKDAEGRLVATAAARDHFAPTFNRTLCKRLIETAELLNRVLGAESGDPRLLSASQAKRITRGQDDVGL